MKVIDALRYVDKLKACKDDYYAHLKGIDFTPENEFLIDVNEFLSEYIAFLYRQIYKTEVDLFTVEVKD